MRRPGSAAVARLALGLIVLAGCVGPARTSSAYRAKARNSAKAVLSAVSTSQLVAKVVRDKGAFATYISVALDSAERDATSTESTFASIQPPDAASDQLRDDLNNVLNDASDTISSMRIAARRRDWDKLMRAAADLPELSQKLQKYEDLPA